MQNTTDKNTMGIAGAVIGLVLVVGVLLYAFNGPWDTTTTPAANSPAITNPAPPPVTPAPATPMPAPPVAPAPPNPSAPR